jgi:transcriptional regulator GlxA family with amidase domain
VNPTLRVAILAFDDVEALDLAGPYEVFTTASRMAQRAAPDAPSLFEVTCVARSLAPVRMRAGLSVLPEHSFADAPPADVLIVPGGVVDAAMQCAATLKWIASASRDAFVTASVCTGAFLLAASGVLRDGPVTTHWEDIADLRMRCPSLDVRENVRWIDRGSIVTSAGITAGIHMSLHLVARLADEALALRTARQMDFTWTRPD